MIRALLRGARYGFSSGYWIVTRLWKVCRNTFQIVLIKLHMQIHLLDTTSQATSFTRHATTTAPVTIRFTSANGSITFQPQDIS